MDSITNCLKLANSSSKVIHKKYAAVNHRAGNTTTAFESGSGGGRHNGFQRVSVARRHACVTTIGETLYRERMLEIMPTRDQKSRSTPRHRRFTREASMKSQNLLMNLFILLGAQTAMKQESKGVLKPQ